MATRVVLDRRVFVAAVRSDGVSRLLLVRALDGAFVALASIPLMVEYESALLHHRTLAASGIPASGMHALVDAFAAMVEPVALTPIWRPVLRDAADDAALETAVQGAADVLVTLDPRAFGDAADYPGLIVASPAAALGRLESRS
jgi:putative PIN family toxin of toxin-antitoxin system